METDLKLQSVAEILAEMSVDDYRGFLIDNVIDSSVSTILGDSFMGKTFLSLDITRSLLTGEPFLGRDVLVQLERVAFLCTDPKGKFDVATRAQLAGLDSSRILAAPMYTPDDADAWREHLAMLQREHIGAVILDNTSDLANDANSPREVKAVTDGLRRWTDEGMSVINLHHMNKNAYGKSGFGSTIWQKWTRCEIKLTGRKPENPDRTLAALPNSAAATTWKLKFDPSSSPFFTVTDEASTMKLESERDQQAAARDRAIAEWVVASCQGIANVSEVARKVQATHGVKFDTFRRMQNKGHYPLGHDGKGTWILR